MIIAAVLAFWLPCPGAAAAEKAPGPDPVVTRIAEGFHRLAVPESYQTNIGVLSGPDGLLLIDTGHSSRAVPQLKAVLESVSRLPVKVIIHTHAHADHQAGDALGTSETLFIDAGRLDGLAARGILKRPALSVASDAPAFGPSYILRFDGEDVTLFPAGGIHSEEDILVFLPGKKILQTGDLFLSESFPATDKVRDYMAFLERIVGFFPAGTRFVPGHGRDVDSAGFKAYRDMLAGAVEIVRAAKARGMSLDEMLRTGILKEFEARHTLLDWLGPDMWTRSVYASY